MQQKTKLEHLQLVQTLCIWGVFIFGAITGLCGAGIKIYDNKIKKEESRLKQQETDRTSNSEGVPQPMIVNGDYVAGNKRTQTNSKMTEENKNSGTNNGNIGGSGNTINNNQVYVTSNNQQGGITAHTVNIGNQQRVLQKIHIDYISSNIPDKETPIELTAQMGDPEAYNFCNEIREYLLKQGYTKVGPIDTMLPFTPTFGQIIEVKDGKARVFIGPRE